MRLFHLAVPLMLLAACLALAPHRTWAASNCLVVCPDEFREALNPWLAWRRKQGHRIKLIANPGSPADLRAKIRELARGGKLDCVVLVGDADPRAARDADLQRVSIPVHKIEAKVNIHWGRERDIATDNWYADTDDDDLPDLAIGRITADTSQELQKIVEKILSYEKQADYGTWRRSVDFVAGMGGFGQMADAALEMGAKRFITQGLPPAYDVHVTYGSWRSPYCPDPRAFHAMAVERLNAGNLFWVYIGHGSRRELDEVNVPGDKFPIFASPDIRELKAKTGPAVAIFLACYTGAFDDERDCLAEDLLRAPGAPVAVLSSSRVSMPYGMTVMGNELMRQYFVDRRETLGEMLQQAKRGMLERPRTDESSKLLDSVAPALNPKSKDLAAERREHLALFNLIGDPLLRLPQPEAVEIEAPSQAEAGTTITVSGHSKVEGTAVIDCVLRRDLLTFKPPVRKEYQASPEVLAAYQPTYEQANDHTLSTAKVTIGKDGRFQAELKLPAEITGPCHVRAFVAGRKAYALGAFDLEVRPAAAVEAK